MISSNEQSKNEVLPCLTSCQHLSSLSSYDHLTELNLSHLQLIKIDQFPFEQFPQIHSLDLSYNQLIAIEPNWSKSFENSIEYLNISHNRLETLLFLKDFKDLKTLDITDNRLRSNERLLSLYICPTIEHLIESDQELIPTEQLKQNQSSSLLCIKKDVENDRISQQFLDDFDLSMTIRENSKSQYFEPIKFLRSHHQNSNDLTSISVHMCAFEPNTLDNNLATCGGHKVCLVNCNTCEITHLFEIATLPSTCRKKKTGNATKSREYFSCLCWIEIEIEKESMKILAVGATNGSIYLLLPKWKLMFGHLELPASSISCITWHSSHPYILVTGSCHTVRFINIRSYIDRLQSFIRKQNRPTAQFDYDDSSMFVNKASTTHIYNLYDGIGPRITITDLLFYPLSKGYTLLLVGTTSGLFVIKHQEKHDQSPIQLALPKSIWTVSEHIESLRFIDTPTPLIAMNILHLDQIYCFDLEQSLQNQQIHILLSLPNPCRQTPTKIALFSKSTNNHHPSNASFECIVGSHHGSFFYHQIQSSQLDKPPFNNQPVEISSAHNETSPLPSILSASLNEHYLCLTTNTNLICIYKRQ